MHNCLSLTLITCRPENSVLQFEQESRWCSVKRGGRVNVGPSLMGGNDSSVFCDADQRETLGFVQYPDLASGGRDVDVR
jgi:hypothetical protein